MASPLNTPLAPGLARRVKKVIETRTETTEALGALSSLSSFYEENTTGSRRQLRNTLEQRGLSFNNDFLSAAEAVNQALSVVQGDLDGLSSCCQQTSGALTVNKASITELLGALEQVQRDLEVSEKRSQLVHAFLDEFQLSAEELAALREDTLGPAFFDVLARVGAIHANCRRLLRTHHQRAGLELMDAMSAHQESAYERLCRWVQGECRNLGDMDAPEVNPLLQRAAEALRERPVLFKYCAEEVASARHSALFSRFVTALTRGGPGGMPRPMELQAHDPRRYVGDMLAWVHQALASERELFVSLFGDEGLPDVAPSGLGQGLLMPTSSNASSTGPRRTTSAGLSSADGTPDTATMLDRVFESICRPLKVRIEQVLLGAHPLLLSFALTQLLSFYTGTVTRLLGRSSQLAATLGACRALAARAFADQLKARGDRLLRNPPVPPPDLSPPPQVAEGVKQLKELVASFEAAFEAGSGHTAEAEFAPVLAAIVDPILTVCERSAEALAIDAPTRVDEAAHVDPTARHTFLINCLTHIGEAMEGHACCTSRARDVSKAVEGHMAGLAGSTAGALLARCNLIEPAERVRLYNAGDAPAANGAMAADPALPMNRLAGALRACYVLISQPDALPEMRALQVPRLRAQAVQRVAQTIANAYDTVHAAVAEPHNGYLTDPLSADALRHTPTHIRTILGIS